MLRSYTRTGLLRIVALCCYALRVARAVSDFDCIYVQRCHDQEKIILELRHDLHWTRIAFTVARAMLPFGQRDACFAEIKRQASLFHVGNERMR